MNLEQLFNIVRDKAKYNKKNVKKFNGQAFWQPIKNILEKSKWYGTWKKVPKALYSETIKLPEYYINGLGQTKIIESNHFIIQTVRIPQKELPSLRKVIQIALNVGQYTADHHLDRTELKDYIMTKECNIQLDKILNKSEIHALIKVLE